MSGSSVTVRPGNETQVTPSGLNEAVTSSPLRTSRRSRRAGLGGLALGGDEPGPLPVLEVRVMSRLAAIDVGGDLEADVIPQCLFSPVGRRTDMAV